MLDLLHEGDGMDADTDSTVHLPYSERCLLALQKKPIRMPQRKVNKKALGQPTLRLVSASWLACQRPFPNRLRLQRTR